MVELETSLAYKSTTYQVNLYGVRISYVKLSIHQCLLRHKLASNDGFSNFKLLVLIQNSSYVVQILHGISYEVWSIFITKFGTIE